MMNTLSTLSKSIFLSASLCFLTSCNQPSFINLTSGNLSQNPSGIYTLQTELDIQDRKVNQDTIQVFAIVGGDTIPMVKDPVNPFLWSCD